MYINYVIKLRRCVRKECKEMGRKVYIVNLGYIQLQLYIVTEMELKYKYKGIIW